MRDFNRIDWRVGVAALALAGTLAASATAASPAVLPSAPVPDAALRKVLAGLSAQMGLDLLDDQCGQCLLARWEFFSSFGRDPGWMTAAAATARLAVATQTSADILTAAYNRLGVSLRWLEDFPAAQEAFLTASQMAGGEHQAALANLAEVERLQGKTTEAVADARRSLTQPRVGLVLKDPRSLLCVVSPPAPGDARKNRAPLRVGAAVQKPERLVTPTPVYTDAARKARLQGVVVLEAVIDEDGCVRDAQLLKGLELGLDKAALDAVGDWVFKPATLDGKPVSVYYTLTVNFQVEQDRARRTAPGAPLDMTGAAPHP